MKQTAKRLISMLLTLLMVVSMVSVYTFAANSNYEIDEEWYNRAANDAVVVNPAWAGFIEGDPITFIYRNKTIKESFDPYTHFSDFEVAYDYLVSSGQSTPVIILCPGVYNQNIKLKGDVTILGTSAGIDPSTKGKDDTTPWEVNENIGYNTVIRGLFEVDKFLTSNIEVIFDGVTFSNGFGYIDAGARAAESNVIVKNSSFKNLGAFTYNLSAINKIFYFDTGSALISSVALENVRVTGMNTATLLGSYLTKFSATNLYYADCAKPIASDLDALAGQNPEYIIKDSLFYNNNTEYGSIVIDHSIKDSSTRTSSLFEISNTVFLEGNKNAVDVDAAIRPAITFVIAGDKNKVNIHDCKFIAVSDRTVSPIDLNYAKGALTAPVKDCFKFNDNLLIGYTMLNDSTGLLRDSKLDFSSNYYSNVDGVQVDPIYPTSSSYNNIVVDYFWLDKEMTIPSKIYHPTSIGYEKYDIDNVKREISLSIDPGKKFDFNIKTTDAGVTYKTYANASLTKEIKTVDSANLFTGYKSNVFYAKGTSTKVPSYSPVYKIYVTTYNPAQLNEFSAKNTFMFTPEVAGMKDGDVICKDWDGTAYKFIVGKTIFATIEEVFEVADENPTILMPAGIYKEDIGITASATILGAKHGINPNVPQFDRPEEAWAQNPDRLQEDQEAILEGSVLYLHSEAVNAVVTVDGITLGQGSSFSDTGKDLDTYTTITLKNIIIANATAGSYNEKLASGAISAKASSAILSFCGTDLTGYDNNHKDIRLFNIRMENQGNDRLLGNYFESMLIDGLYYAGNSSPIHKVEWTAPVGQNFSLTVRNSCFYKNTPSASGGLWVSENTQTYSKDREFYEVIVDHNTFYEACQYAYGLFGARFHSGDDRLQITNNTIISSKPNALIPGNTNWLKGLVATDVTAEPELQEIVSDVTIQFNRICGPVTPIDLTNAAKGTLFNYNFNYVVTLNTSNYVDGIFNKNTTGENAPNKTWTGGAVAKTTYYYTDYAMTKLTSSGSNDDIMAGFDNALDYSFGGSGLIGQVDETNFTYSDTVPSSQDTYDFGIDLKTHQASANIYSDEELTTPVTDIVLDKAENVFYIVLKSASGAVKHTYKATIKKDFTVKAEIESFGKATITENEVISYLPIGTDTLSLDNIKVSVGATYEIFNDEACTELFADPAITAIGTEPTYKYIKVTASDSVSKVYKLTAVQGANKNGDLIAVENAVKTSDTKFEAIIPFDVSSFAFVPTFSENAELEIDVDGIKYSMTETESFGIHNIGTSKTAKITVKSETGVVKNYTLTIARDKSTTDISYIRNMYNNGDDTSKFFTKINSASFEVVPTFKNIATKYAVYSDLACTQAYANNTVTLGVEDVVAYLKATSEDGKSAKIYTLYIHTEKPDPNYKPPTSGGDTPGGNTPGGNDKPLDPKPIKTFTDVAANSWYKTYVDYAVSYGMFSGTSDTTFSPNAEMTRAQFVQVLANLSGAQLDNSVKSGFDDVASNQWFTAAVKWAADNGVASGVGEGKFNPNGKIDRQQMCVMLVNYAEKYIKTTLKEKVAYTSFSDANAIASWAKGAVEKCYKAELVKGTGNNTFSPKKIATRSEGATIFTNFHKDYVA